MDAGADRQARDGRRALPPALRGARRATRVGARGAPSYTSPASPYISLHLHISPYISPYLAHISRQARSAHLLEAARSEREQREFHARSAEVLKKHAFTAAKVRVRV